MSCEPSPDSIQPQSNDCVFFIKGKEVWPGYSHSTATREVWSGTQGRVFFTTVSDCVIRCNIPVLFSQMNHGKSSIVHKIDKETHRPLTCQLKRSRNLYNYEWNIIERRNTYICWSTKGSSLIGNCPNTSPWKLYDRYRTTRYACAGMWLCSIRIHSK